MQLKNFTIEKTIKTQSLVVATGEMDGEKYVYLIDTISAIENLTDEFIKTLLEKENTKQEIEVDYKTILIYPAKESKIRKYFEEKEYLLETYEEYKAAEVETDISWIENIFTGNDTENVYFKNEEIVVVADSKWNMRVDEMYLLVLFKNKDLLSIRDLDRSHVELLEEVKKDVYKLVKDMLNLNEEDICMYFHYKPSYYRLHIHVINISKTTHCLHNTYRSILLDDVIRNIKMDENYYKQDMKSIS